MLRDLPPIALEMYLRESVAPPLAAVRHVLHCDGSVLTEQVNGPRVYHAGAQTDLRAMQCAIAARFARRAHLLVRMHVLRDLCREDFRKRLSQLRRRVRSKAHQTIAELEG